LEEIGEEMTRDELIWLAGFIDGEGYIGICRKGSVRMQSQLRIATCHLPTMQYVASLVEGKLYVTSHEGTRWKDSYVTVVYDKRCEEILTMLLPYLVTKKAQARAVIDFRKSLKRGRNQTNPKTRQECDEEHRCYEVIKILNQRGRA
jgi:hypothetical protein